MSHKGVMKYAELKGIKLYSWVDDISLKHQPGVTVEDALLVHYATVPKEEYDKFIKLWHEADIKERHTLGDGGLFSERDIERTDSALIQVVELLGEESYGICARLKIVEIPDGTEWIIGEYDGVEHIAETHRTWN